MSKTKNIKAVKESNKDPFAEANNKRFNDEREQFVQDFRKINDLEMVERLYKFLMVNDEVAVTENGLYGFGAFSKAFFEAGQAPGQTGLEVYATEKYAQQHTREYVANVISALALGTLKDKVEKEVKKASGNDYKDKE